MAWDFADSNAYIYGFQIHHILPSELYDDADIGSFLTKIGISLESKANKIALPTSSILTSLFQSSPTLQSILSKAGWGVEHHFSGHSNYTQFLMLQFANIIFDSTLTASQKALRGFELLEYATDMICEIANDNATHPRRYQQTHKFDLNGLANG